MITDSRSSNRKLIKRTVCFELSVRESGGQKNILYDGCCVDISPQGICLITDYYFKKGEVLKLLIPAIEVTATIPVFAEVVWSKLENGNYRTGLRFLTPLLDEHPNTYNTKPL